MLDYDRLFIGGDWVAVSRFRRPGGAFAGQR